MTGPGATRTGRFGVFLSYARSDGEPFANDLRQRLSKDLPSLRVWQDRPEIEGGVGWWRQIETALDQVEFLVSVMTPAALASEITAREWRAARQRGVCVFPVQGPGFDFADPRLPRWMARAHFYDLDQQWDTFKAHLQRGCQVARVPFMAPDLPIGFVQRSKEFMALRSLLLDSERSDPVAITTALTGAGGFGKTTLAAALCHDEAILQAFDDGILWTTLGETPNIADALAKLYAGLTGERPPFKDAEDATACLAEKLERKSCLIVIDDVWDPAHLRPFLRGGDSCARLITSRLRPVATEAQARTVTVDEMGGDEAVAMLTARLERPPADLAPWRALARRLGEWPLALKLAAAAIVGRLQRGDSLASALSHVNTALDRRGFTSLGNRSGAERDAALASTVAVSLGHLSEEQRRRYSELAVFPEDTAIPTSVVAELWDLDVFDSEELLEQLADASLLELDLAEGEMRLHDVLRAFLGEALGAEALGQAHHQLIERWGDLHRLPDAADPAYGWRWVGYHLKAAGRQGELDALLGNLSWLQSKLNATDILSLEGEFAHASATPALSRLRRLLSSASHVLASHPEQLPSQLLARWPRESPDAAASAGDLHREEPLRKQAAALIKQAGGACPLTASLVAQEALLRTLTGHSGEVSALAVLPDGRLASGSRDGTIRLWDPASDACTATFQGHSGPVNALAVLPDGRLASGGDNGSIRLWDPASGACSATFNGHSDSVTTLAVLPDGRFASGGATGTIRLWDPASGTCTATLEGHTKKVWSLVVLPDGRLASGSDNGTIRIWDPSSGTYIPTFNDYNVWVQIQFVVNSVYTLVVLPDGRLASGSTNAPIKLWDPTSGTSAANLEGHFDFVLALAVLPDGRLASGSGDGTIRLWDPASGTCTATLEGHTDTVWSLVVLPDGRLASGSANGTIRLWNTASGSSPSTLKCHSKDVCSLAVLPDQRLASCSLDRTIRLWDPAKRVCSATFEGHSGVVNALAVLPDGRLASGSGDYTIRLWDPVSGACTATLKGVCGPVWSLAVFPDGRLASGHDPFLFNFRVCDDVNMWNLCSGTCTVTINSDCGPVRALAVLLDGRLASGGRNGTIRLWDPASGACTATLKGHSGWVRALAILPNGWFASGSLDKTIRLWDPATGACSATFGGHSGGVNALTMLPDGRLASGSLDNTIRFWDPASGDPRSSQLFFVADAAITALAFLAGTSVLVAGDASGRLHWLRLG